MRRYENRCVGCPTEIGCLGSSCPYKNVPLDYCDSCGREGVTHKIDGDVYCDDCTKAYLQEVFDSLTITEKAEVLEVNISKIDN